MRQRLNKLRASERGFTLTELLIVIVILGVLTGIVVFAVGAFNDRGEVAACKADLKSTQVAVEAYRAQTGNYPAADAWATLVPTYLKDRPNSPKYTITLAANGLVTGDLAGGATPSTDCSS